LLVAARASYLDVMPSSADTISMPNTDFPLLAAGELVIGVSDARTLPYWFAEALLRMRVLDKVLHAQHVPKVAELTIDAGVITTDAQHIVSFVVNTFNVEALYVAAVAPNCSRDCTVVAAHLLLTNRFYCCLQARGNAIYNNDDVRHLALAYDAKVKQLHTTSEVTTKVTTNVV
jgi:hypothetical protein